MTHLESNSVGRAGVSRQGKESRTPLLFLRNPKLHTLFPSIPQNLHCCPLASHHYQPMADKEIVPYVAPESRQGDPLSPMEQYLTEALQEEAFSVTATSPAMPRSTPRRKDLRGARGRSADHPVRPTSPRARSAPGFCNTRFIKGHKSSNHIRARIKSHVYTTE